LRLRRRWTPPPGWPRQRRGFIPPAGWQPDPTWPAAPEDWQFWRVPRLRVFAALVLIGFAVLIWSGTVADLRAWRQHSALDKRGVTTAATLVSYSYDPDGGDPGGWTTDQVSFRTTAGAAIVATVGHHDPGPERASRVIDVTYDPRHPTVVRAARYVDDADDPGNAVAGAILATLVTAAAASLTSRVVTRPDVGDRLSTRYST
jgi:hypothetical protein